MGKNKGNKGKAIATVVEAVLSAVAPGVVTVDAVDTIAPVATVALDVQAPVVNDTVAPVVEAVNSVVTTPAATQSAVNRLVAIARTARAVAEDTGEVYCVTGQQRAFAVMLRKLCIAKCNGNEAMGNSLAAKLCVHAFGYSVQKGREALGETSASGMVRYMGYARKQGHAYYAKMHDKCDAVKGKVERLFLHHAKTEGYTGEVVVSDKPSE